MWIKHGSSSGFKFTHTKPTILIFYHHDGTALFARSFLVLSFLLIAFALITAVVSVVAIISVVAIVSGVALVLHCSLFSILGYYTYRFFLNQSPVPFSVGSSTTRIRFDAGGTSSRSVSICSQGYVMDCFIAVQWSFLSWNQVWPVSEY